MAQKTMNPAALAGADRARKCDCLAAVRSENSINPVDFQSLSSVAEVVLADVSARRASWIVTRYPVSPQLARLLADLAFDGRATR